MAVLGNGTDTGNSIRMPAATSALVGVFPTRGLVSTAGIAPLDWLLDNTGPIARTVTDAAIALSVMSGEDLLDPATTGSQLSSQPAPYETWLKAERPATREMFMKAVEALRAAGAEVILDDQILSAGFTKIASRVATYAYVQDGTDRFLANFGPSSYRSAAEYLKAVGSPLYASSIGTEEYYRNLGGVRIEQRRFDTDSDAERMYHLPRRKMLETYLEPLDRLKLDGYVYPAIQMPPPDETIAQDGRLSEGPHSATSWVNMIGVPAVVVPAGFYPNGLPFGLEFSARPWRDGDLLAMAYAFEQATRLRRPPVLVERGLLPIFGK